MSKETNKARREEYRNFKPFLNLSMLHKFATDGLYNSVEEINEEFDKALASVERWRNKTLDKFEESQQCSHEYGKPWYYLKRNLFGDYYYEFHKKCIHCSKEVYVEGEKVIHNEHDCPEGFEGATKQYWNNDI